jgi:glycosyltransferase involved in cell wall biosynthesis
MGEATFLNTGYGVYGREVLSRLHETGKYEIAELGGYGHFADPRAQEIPWTYYGNLPDTPEDNAEYDSQLANQWGLWKFEEICLDFKPDIVIDIRDWWAGEYVSRSPFRRNFDWAIMPTIDSAPQMEQWLATYLDADAVCAYSEFGRDAMMQETNNHIKFCSLAPPAADYDYLKPVPDKRKHREALGFEPNVKIVGTIMRNQKRKLYPDLLASFRTFLEQYPETGHDTFLYLHTSYPDIGWDIPRLIRESGIGHKILCTYICHDCGHVFPSFFHDAVQTCSKCGRPSARLPSGDKGAHIRDLAAIINCFDVYVQYSICEGFGMPQVEAAACGVPVMAVDYSAMSSVVRNLKGTPIEVERLFRESETHAYRALPSNDDLAHKLGRFLSKPESLRLKAGRDAYLACRKHYDWSRTAKVWEDLVDNMQLRDHSTTWNAPSRAVDPNLNIPNDIPLEDFVRWGVVNIWGEPTQVDSFVALRMIRDLNYGEAIDGFGGPYYSEDSAIIEKPKFRAFGKPQAINALVDLGSARNYWEQRRTGLIDEAEPRFITRVRKAEKRNGEPAI